jgi:metal-responsive CopG/Arc/MetJ family transcriptional regulator
VPNQPKTPNRVVRVDDDLWRDFGDAIEDEGTTRSEAIRTFIRWYLRRPGAKLPDRPPR